MELVDTLMGHRLDEGGVRPREADGLDGILFAPLLHYGWGHLVANTLPLLVFGFLILLAGVARWAAVTAVVWVVGGVGTWFAGQPHSIHLGASVLAFGWLVYLLLRGVFARDAVAGRARRDPAARVRRPAARRAAGAAGHLVAGPPVRGARRGAGGVLVRGARPGAPEPPRR